MPALERGAGRRGGPGAIKKLPECPRISRTGSGWSPAPPPELSVTRHGKGHCVPGLGWGEALRDPDLGGAPQGAGPQVLSPPPSHGGGDDCRWWAPSGEGREPGRGWGSHWRPRRDGRRRRPEDSYTWQPSGLTDNCISGGAGGARFQESGKGVQSQELGGAKMSIFPPSPLRRRRPRPHKRPRP